MDEPDEKIRVEKPETYAVGWPAITTDGSIRRGRDGRSPRHQDAPQGEPRGRIRLPELRVARPASQGSKDGRVLRKRRESDVVGGDDRSRHAGVLRNQCGERSSCTTTRTRLNTTAGSPSRCTSHPERTTTPRSSWDDAFTLIAERLRALPTPNHAAFYTSGRASNEAAFVFQLLARRFGTNNLPDCSNMCHESSGTALTRSHRRGQGHGRPR